MMFRHAHGIRRCAALIVVCFALAMIPVLNGQMPAHSHAIVDWYANLTGATDASALQADTVRTRATGKATASFDFDRQAVTFNVEAKDIRGVQKIEVRSSRVRGDLSGPTIFTIYDSHDGPFTGSVSKTVTGPAFKQITTPIVNGQSVVVICTVTYPDGEIASSIGMHKRYE